jgi:broad specificity phosphatase PhoE
MSMVRLVRHAKSTANRSIVNSVGLRNHIAGLSEEGLEQNPALRGRIAERVFALTGGRDLSHLQVNVSELWRTQQQLKKLAFWFFELCLF